MKAKPNAEGVPFEHPPGSPFHADYQPQTDWSELASTKKYAHAPAEGTQLKGWGNGTIPGLSAKADPAKAGRMRKASALG